MHIALVVYPPLRASPALCIPQHFVSLASVSLHLFPGVYTPRVATYATRLVAVEQCGRGLDRVLSTPYRATTPAACALPSPSKTGDRSAQRETQHNTTVRVTQSKDGVQREGSSDGKVRPIPSACDPLSPEQLRPLCFLCSTVMLVGPEQQGLQIRPASLLPCVPLAISRTADYPLPDPASYESPELYAKQH